MRPVRLAVAGAGVIGKRHIEEVAADPDVTLASIVDHGPVGSELAPKYGVPLYQSLAELFEQVAPTPSQRGCGRPVLSETNASPPRARHPDGRLSLAGGHIMLTRMANHV